MRFYTEFLKLELEWLREEFIRINNRVIMMGDNGFIKATGVCCNYYYFHIVENIIKKQMTEFEESLIVLGNFTPKWLGEKDKWINKKLPITIDSVERHRSYR